MTTAYTSLLGLALPVTGELSGTWGDVVNNSITGLLDTAVAGTTTLSTDADVTLSTTTGAANQSRQAIILWTASGTVTRTITAPAQSKIYTIINRSSTQSIKIVGVGPTTGVTVKSGATVTVAWNGLDFVEISVSTLYPTVTISGNMDNGTTDNSLNNAPTVKSAVTTLASVYLSNPSTEAASFTLTDLVGYRSEQGTFGASSTVTNQYGFYANSDLTGATNNYGVYSGIAATAAVTISSVNGTGSTVTVDTSTSHGLNTGDKVIIAGVSNTTMTAGSYNGGPYTITLVDSNTFTFSSSATSSAAVTSGGSVVKSNNWNIYAGGTGNNWFGGPTVKSVSSVLPALRITQTGTGDALLVEDSSNPDSTPFVIDATGAVVVGATTSSALTISGVPQLSQGGTTATFARNAFSRWDASATGFAMQFGKSRSGTVGTFGIVSSGDSAGQLQFFGDDGTAFVSLATISAFVDGTPGVNDMPGRLVFSTTADGASTVTERMRINSAGNVGLNATSLSNTAFRNSVNITGSTTSYAMFVDGVVQSDVTSSAVYFTTSARTAAASFTANNIKHYRAAQGTFGVGSTVTAQYGFVAEDNLIGATNNYGFYGDIPAATGRWNFYAAGTAENFFGGNTVVSVTDNTNAALRITQLGTGNALLVEDSTNPDSTPFVIDASGNVIVGYTTAVATQNYGGFALTSNYQQHGTAQNTSTAAIFNWATSAGSPPNLILNKSLSGAVGTRGALTAAGNDIGAVTFNGDDGTNFIPAAAILVEADGTPGTNDMPGRFLFLTTADGASTPTERMRIDSAGNVGIGATAPITKLEVAGNNNITWSVTASITGTTMDVTAFATSGIAVGDLVFGANIQAYTRVTALGTGTGGIGTYTVSVSQTAASGSVTGGATYGNTLIRITDTDTAQNIGQPTGGLQFFTSDGSSPTAGVGAYVAALAESTTPDTALVFGTRDNVGGGIDANERMRINSSGNLLLGYLSQFATTNYAGTAITPLFQNIGSAASTSSAGLWNWSSSSSSSSTLVFSKSASSTVGTRGAISTNGTDLGNIAFTGDDGTNFVTGAAILAELDGTVSTGVMPGRLSFLTTAAASGTPTERMRIDSSGNLGINTTTTTRARLNIDTDGTNTSAGYGLALTNTAGGGTTWTLQCGDQGVNNGAFTIRQTGISGTTYFKIEASTGYITVPGVYTLTTASAANVFVGTGGDLRRSTSSLKYKTDVQDATYGLAEVMVLRPVTYKGKNDGDTIFGGLIAEEVDAAGLTEFVQYADDGTPDALAYGNMVSLCIKAIQEQQALITALTARIEALENK